MRIFSTCLLLVASGCCSKRESDNVEIQLISVVYHLSQPPDEVTRILWQKSYPDAYADLIAKLRDRPDPFSSKIEVAEADLVPSNFGIYGWERAIVPQTFEALGYPTGDTEGSWAAYYASKGVFELVHTDEAIRAFEQRFPELTTANKTVNPTADRL